MLGCGDAAIDVTSGVRNVTQNHVECLIPPELSGHTGRVEIQVAVDGHHFVRPDNQGRNRVRPKIHYFFYRQRMYSRVPAGGPLRGGTRVTIIGEGIDAAAATYDAITNMLLTENLLGTNIRRWYDDSASYGHGGTIGLPQPFAMHSTVPLARAAILANTRCRFGDFGDSPVETVSYSGSCFQAGESQGLSCVENTTVTCLAPLSVDATDVEIGVSTNGNDAISGPHFVPLGDRYTYYATPIASQLVPPGGPIIGGTSVTVRGQGFAGLGAVQATFKCTFEGASGVGGIVHSVGADGSAVVCNTTSHPNVLELPLDREVSISLNDQDFDVIASYRFYQRPQLRRIRPTGGPTLPGYIVTLSGTGFGGMAGVVMPFAPLCRVGGRVGSVLSMSSYEVEVEQASRPLLRPPLTSPFPAALPLSPSFSPSPLLGRAGCGPRQPQCRAAGDAV